jgi:PIN domain nuclease of toxin-antitoxin system
MRLLLDSHALLWFITEPERLRRSAFDAIADPLNDVAYSAISLWELAISRAKGRLRYTDVEMRRGIDGQGFAELPVLSRYGPFAAALPPLHQDPFDRMLIAQAMLEGLTLVTHDWLIRRYPAVALMEA